MPAAILALLAAAPLAAGEPARQDLTIPGEPGIFLHLRELLPAGGPDPALPAVLLVHGARFSGVPSFDLPVAGGSLAADLATAGHAVYLVDVRGYGGSTRPPAMDGPPGAARPQVRSNEAVRDLAAAVDFLSTRPGATAVALVGWGMGGHWAGLYASLYPERVSHLVLYDPLYGGTPGHPDLGAGSNLEDRGHPGHFNTALFGAYRPHTEAALLLPWDRAIPETDKTIRRDPALLHALVRAVTASDPASGREDPPVHRVPSGPVEDSFYLALGRQFYDASLIRCPTLVVRGERDRWSRPADAERLLAHLAHAPLARAVTLADATHWAHLERPPFGRDALLAELKSFLATTGPPAQPPAALPDSPGAPGLDGAASSTSTSPAASGPPTFSANQATPSSTRSTTSR